MAKSPEEGTTQVKIGGKLYNFHLGHSELKAMEKRTGQGFTMICKRFYFRELSEDLALLLWAGVQGDAFELPVDVESVLRFKERMKASSVVIEALESSVFDPDEEAGAEGNEQTGETTGSTPSE